MVILETVKFHIRNKSRFNAQYVYCFTPHMLNYLQFQWLSVSDAANIPHRLWPMGLISSAHNDPTSSLSGSVSNIRRDDSILCVPPSFQTLGMNQIQALVSGCIKSRSLRRLAPPSRCLVLSPNSEDCRLSLIRTWSSYLTPVTPDPSGLRKPVTSQ